VIFALLTWNIAQFREDFRLPLLNRVLTEGSKKNLHRRPRRAQRDGLETGGVPKFAPGYDFRCVENGSGSSHGRSSRAWVAVVTAESSRLGEATYPMIVMETQFLIGLCVLCGLLCICSSSQQIPVGDGFPEVKRDASPSVPDMGLN